MNNKNTDCYYFYNSTCKNGDGCAYRHCIEALGNNKVCTYWLKKMCERQNCRFRHSNNLGNRSETLCFYESKESGCMKAHCLYKHQKPRLHLKEAIDHNDSSVILPVRSSRRERNDSYCSNTSSEDDAADAQDDGSSNESDSTNCKSKDADIDSEKRASTGHNYLAGQPKKEKHTRKNVLLDNLFKKAIKKAESNQPKNGPKWIPIASNTIPIKTDIVDKGKPNRRSRSQSGNRTKKLTVSSASPLMKSAPPPLMTFNRQPTQACPARLARPARPVLMPPNQGFVTAFSPLPLPIPGSRTKQPKKAGSYPLLPAPPFIGFNYPPMAPGYPMFMAPNRNFVPPFVPFYPLVPRCMPIQHKSQSDPKSELKSLEEKLKDLAT